MKQFLAPAAHLKKSACAAGMAALWLFAALMSSAAHADEPNRDARRLQLLQQRFQEEKSQLETENGDLKKKLADQEAELGKLRAGQQSQQKTSAALAQQERELTGKLGDTATELKSAQARAVEQKQASDAEIARKDRELAEMKKARDADVNRLQAQLDEARGVITICGGKNEKLAIYGLELIDLYRNKGMLDIMGDNEPVLGLGNVDAFNMMQDYRDKIVAERIKNPLTKK